MATKLNAAFWKWFKGSKVVDANGNPLTMWHATTRKIKTFSMSRCGFGCHFGDRAQAESIVHDFNKPEKAIYMPVCLRIENPLRLQDCNDWTPWNVSRQLKTILGEEWWKGYEYGESHFHHGGFASPEEQWKFMCDGIEALGHDGVVYLNRYEGLFPGASDTMERRQRMAIPGRLKKSPFWPDTTDAEFMSAANARYADSYIAWHPGQIKSVENDGTWNEDDPDIRSNPADPKLMANLRLWYGTDPKPHADVVAAVNKIVAEHAETILPHMKIKDVTTHYVTSLEMQFGEHTLMLYKQSSKDHAIIAIDCRGIKRVLKGMPDGMTLSELIELTLIHEYAHAWIDMAGLKPADEEDVCNAFADALYEEPDNVKGAFAMLRQLARG